ncbi:PLC-like phosphodiesterase [Lindgomyces ingoldianus]|uniref:PLC-like phosphodiesterase n=1 Tax=Lindgomyces ingoldianus TaxID=673940 RepID=A0ACB6R337_9PLEO|nr:PLC-like phosphodiesterase [Lindgomyces ingoldianus]KAF2473734.1 PLC-like phosphodiesterase [Lindgomyces ingoldianus]
MSFIKQWRFSVADSLLAVHITPVGAYVASTAGRIFLLDSIYGKERAHADLGMKGTMKFTSSSQGDVLIVGLNNKAIRLNPTTLQTIWTKDISGVAKSTTVFYLNNDFIFAAGGNTLKRFTLNGTQISSYSWATPHKLDVVMRIVAEDLSNITVYLTGDTNIQAIQTQPKAFREIGKSEIFGSGICVPSLAVGRDGIFLATTKGSASPGPSYVQKMGFNLSGLLCIMIIEEASGWDIRLATDSTKSHLFAGTNGFILKLDTQTLKTLSRVSLPGAEGYGLTSIFVANQDVFVGCNGCVYQFDLDLRMTGRTVDPSLSSEMSLHAISEQMLICGQNGKAYAIKLQPSVTSYGPWMSQLWKRIGPRKLREIALPGTHDSGSYGVTGDSAFGQDKEIWQKWCLETLPRRKKDIAVGWARTTSANFLEQLKMGIRYFDLRVALENPGPSFVHGLVGPSYLDLFDQLEDWYKDPENAYEIVLLDFNHFYNMVLDPDHPEQGPHAEIISNLHFRFNDKLFPYANEESRDLTIFQIWNTPYRIFAFYANDIAVKNDRFLWPREKKETSAISVRWAQTDDIETVIDVAEAVANDTINKFKVMQFVRSPSLSMYTNSFLSTRSSIECNQDSLLGLADDMAEESLQRLAYWKGNPTNYKGKINVVVTDWFNVFAPEGSYCGLPPFVDAVVKLNE